MFSFRRHGSGPLYGALIDIGSGTIGVALVASDLGKQLPTIIYQSRTTMRVGKHTGADRENIRRVREMLLTASLTLGDAGLSALRNIDPHATVSELCVTVSSPWSYTIVHNVEFKDDDPFRVTPAILQDLVESAETAILERVGAESTTGKDGYQIVERATVGVTLNEYPVENPLRMEGTVLNLSHVAGLIPTEIIESVHEIQDKLFPKSRLHAHTSMLSMYSVLADLFPRTHSFCIVDVTAEATEFGIIEDDILIENTFIPVGTNKFLQSVMGKRERPLADIETMLRTFADKTVTADADVTTALAEYSEAVKGGATSIRERRTFPNKIVVVAHEPFGDAFAGAVERGVRSALEKKPNLVAVNKHLIEEICHGTGGDVYLALAARFFHKLHDHEKNGGA